MQDLASERPNMSIVISMLDSDIVSLLPPRQPAFIQWQGKVNDVPTEENEAIFSNNGLSISEVRGR